METRPTKLKPGDLLFYNSDEHCLYVRRPGRGPLVWNKQGDRTLSFLSSQFASHLLFSDEASFHRCMAIVAATHDLASYPEEHRGAIWVCGIVHRSPQHPELRKRCS